MSADTERVDPDESDSEQAEKTDSRQWRRRLRRTAAVLGTVLLVAAVIPFVVFAVPQVVGADHGFVILSGSMEPDISAGDVVIVDGSRSVDVGDVITFEDDADIPTTHRVVAIEDGAYVTQGDANEEPDDQPVDPDRVLGEVAVTIPYIGYIIVWANSPLGYVALVGVPLTLLLGTELRAWRRRRNDDATPDAAGDSTPGEDVDALRPAIRWRGDQQASDRSETGRQASTESAAAVHARSDSQTVHEFVRANGHNERETVGESAAAKSVPDEVSGLSAVEPDEEVEQSGDDERETTDPEMDAPETDSPETVAVAVADLKLSVLATGVLFAYAGWHVWLTTTAGIAPSPVSVGAMTAGLLGLVLAGWVTVSAWRATTHETETVPERAVPHPETDGGADRRDV
jgi:signal peptidase